MGKIISRFRKKPSTLEELERIDKEIGSLLQLKRRDGELEKQYVGTLVLYSVIVYFIMALVFYFYFVPEDWTGRAIQILPLLLFPFIIWLVRRLIRTYFTRRISRCDIQLSDLRAEKKKILEEVKEKESYKVAKEILEKYDPESVAPPPTPIVSTPSSGRSPPGVTPALRQRLPASGGRGRGRGRGAATPMIPTRQTPGPGTPWTTPRVTGQRPMSRPPSTIRPVLQRERGTVDKLVDYLVGDGPGNRFALICKHCYSHNGMALQEEFEYLAFRCPYCGTFNPSRKTRPNAPKLPESLPSSSAELASSGEDGSSSANEDAQPSNMLPTPETESAVQQEPPANQGRVDETSDDGDNAETEVPLNDDGTGSEAAAAAVASPMNEAAESETNTPVVSEEVEGSTTEIQSQSDLS
ncbi:endoplasmic reticulum junction formation protein lunapark-B-like [Apostichopus japonicus]|uniref:endoplasmic reticulum junction formation protein lunapark-B-like n=1 Tax=Stichopus japonicus TaxID=307972 RepID=UPI003AB640CC